MSYLRKRLSKKRSFNYRNKLSQNYSQVLDGIEKCSFSSSSSESTQSDSESYYSDDSTNEDTFGSFDSSFYNFNEDDEYYIDSNNEDCMTKPIFKGANVNLKEFCIVFISLVSRLRLSLIGINFLLKFLIALLPEENIVPKTHSRILKIFNLSNINAKRICSFCSRELEREKSCANECCIKKKKKKENYNIVDPFLFEFNYYEQLVTLIEKYWVIILDYKKSLVQLTSSDICNSEFYLKKEICLNSISIFLFVDAASFNKSVSGSIWAILAIIVNLPPIIRSKFNNILKIVYISGKRIDFNSLFNLYMKDFKQVMNNIIMIEKLGLKLNVFVHGLIADCPARSKICNTKQFNGNYGCLFCLHPGRVIGRKRVYPFDNNVHRKRDNNIYKQNLNIVLNNNQPYLGIKGFASFLI
jgi:hypothetical protein